MRTSDHISRHDPAARALLEWIDSNELPWMLPLPPWSTRRERRIRRLRRLAHRRLRARTVAHQGWARTVTQSVAWPLIAGVKAWRSLRLFPPPSPSRVSALRDSAIRWWLQVAHNLRIYDQDNCLLQFPHNRARARAFITCREHQALLDNARAIRSGFAGIELKNPFERFCAEYELPSPAAVMTGRGAHAISTRPLPRADLFLKLSEAGKGRGAEMLPYQATSGTWLGHDGEELTEAMLPSYVARRLGEEPWLLQERLRNAESWTPFTPGALATVRIITLRPVPGGPTECLAAYLRLPRSGAVVDNLSANGAGCPVIDLATGELGPVFEWETHRLQDRHPDTGALIRGTSLPAWPELRALALRAHSAAGDWLGIGWDISLTPRGPVIIEANVNFAIPPFVPLGELRYVEIMNSLPFSVR